MFYDIYLYTLCYYICCLLGACMSCTWLCSLKPGVTTIKHKTNMKEYQIYYIIIGVLAKVVISVRNAAE
jgi:hypothetical protein